MLPSPLTAPGATWWSRSSERSMAAWLRCTTVSPRFPYAFSTKALMAAMASASGSTPESLKKQGCITVLMRLPMPTSAATAKASMT